MCLKFLIKIGNFGLKLPYNSQVFAQLVCSFRYGKEDDETMGLSFKKELTLADEQVYPPSKHMKSLGKTRLQERLVTKLGESLFLDQNSTNRWQSQ